MPPGRFFPFVLLAISITFSATAPVPMDTNKDADATLHSTAFLHRPSAFHVLEFRSAPWRRTQSTTRSDVDHDAILAGILHIPPATNAACRRDSDDCTKGFSPSTNDNTPQEPEESLSSRHDVDDNNTADEAGLGYGPWTDAATWALIVYVCASFFLLTYLWSIGWLDRRMTPTSRVPGLESVRETGGLFAAQYRGGTQAAPYALAPYTAHAVRMDGEMRRWGLT